MQTFRTVANIELKCLLSFQLITSKSSLVDLITETLAHIQASAQERKEIMKNVESILNQLITKKLVKWQRQGHGEEERLSLTKFGNAVMESKYGLCCFLGGLAKYHRVCHVGPFDSLF